VADFTYRKRKEVKPVKKSKGKPKKRKVPAYPTTNSDALSVDSSLPTEKRAQRVLEDLLKPEIEAVGKTYSDQHPYLETCVRDLCEDFLRDFQTNFVAKSSRDGRHPNPENDKLQEDLEKWTYFNQRLQRQLSEWGERKRPVESKSSDGGKGVLSKADIDFLKQSQVDVLSRVIPEAHKFASLKGDAILSHLRRISQCVTESHDQQTSLAALVSEHSLSPYIADPKSLIHTLTHSKPYSAVIEREA